MKQLNIILILLIAALPCWGDLTVTVEPGYSFAPGEVPTTDHLNLLGTPTIGVTGTLDGSTSLAAGSVNGTLLADTVPDGATLGYNASVPRSLQVLSAGLAGPGLTNWNTTTLALAVDASLQISSWTNNSGYTNTAAGVNRAWLVNFLWHPWLTGYWSTNAPYYGTNNAWGFTNVTAITNLYFGTNAAPALLPSDTLPVLANQQGTNPVPVPLSVVERWITTQNMQWIATLALNNSNYCGNAYVTNGFNLNSLVLADATGTYALINPGNPILVNAVTNSTPLTAVLTNIANAINTTPAPAGSPQFAATVSGTNVLVYEPLLFYPRDTCTLTPTFAPSVITNVIIGVPTNTTLIYTNLTMTGTPTLVKPFYGGTNGLVGNCPANTIKTVYLNTNTYTELALVCSVTNNGNGGSVSIFVGDKNTNTMVVLGQGTSSMFQVPAQILTLPTGYGIYVNNASVLLAPYNLVLSKMPR